MEMDLKGFERLAGSMLLRAAEDLLSGSTKLRREALEWMDDTNGDELSFVQCCRMLGRDPQQVRGLILRRSKLALGVPMLRLGLPVTTHPHLGVALQ